MNSRTHDNRQVQQGASLGQGSAVALLDEMRSDIAPLLAENGQTFDRLRSTFMIAVQQNPDILKCTPDSLRREISKCAFDGLVPDSKEAVLLPYYDKEAKVYIANYQPMVYGIIKRMKELGSVFNIVCELVCQNDTFTFNAADPDSLSHSWDVLSDTPRGATRAAYVIFRDDQKRVMHREIMTLAELQAIRQASKSPNSPAWNRFEGEMYQKGVLRRGSKYIAINNDRVRTLIERQDDLFDFSQPRAAERVDPFAGRTIEGTATRALEQPTERPMESRVDAEQREREPARQTRRSAPEQTVQPSAKEPATKEQQSEKPSGSPAFPEIEISLEDRDLLIDRLTEVIEIALTPDIEPKERQENLKIAAPHLKDDLPEHLHPLAKACIDITNWAIRRMVEGQPWAGDHIAFVHKLRMLLEVEKLNLSRYP